MDVLEKFLHKISYKFDKGYPDINNEKDILLIESILENLDIKISLHEEVPNRSNTIKAVKKIIDTIGSKYNLSALKSKPNRLSAPGIKDPNEFIDFFKEVFGEDLNVKIYGPLEGPNPSGKFKLFQFSTPELGEVNIIGSYSAPGGAGKSNEDKFIEKLNELILQAGESANIKIISPEYVVNFNKITDVEENFDKITKVIDTSKLGAGQGEKSDVQFLSGEEIRANISLKQDGGFRWASVASLYPEFIKTFQQKALKGEIEGIKLTPNPDIKGKYLMYNSDTDERITKVIIPDLIDNDEDMEKFIFGPEKPKVIVVTRTWKDSDFKLEGNTIIVQASSIYKSLDDIKNSDVSPVFTITQHQGKPMGLDYRIYPANMAKIGSKSKGIELSKDKILN